MFTSCRFMFQIVDGCFDSSYFSLLQVKLWDLSNNQPSCIASKNPKAVSLMFLSAFLKYMIDSGIGVSLLGWKLVLK